MAFVVYESFYKNKGIWGEGVIAKNNTTYYFYYYFNVNSEHLKTKIRSFRHDNSNNNKFRLILMAALIKNVIPVTTARNLIS